MTTEKLDLIVFIGRFSPFHNGHQRIVEEALTLADRVLILVGSSGEARSPRNPWSFEERKRMIDLSIHDDFNWSRCTVEPLYNCTYNDSAWEIQVQHVVDKHCPPPLQGLAPNKIGIIGPKKDPYTEMYINWFPQWVYVESTREQARVDATGIRNELFNHPTEDDVVKDIVKCVKYDINVPQGTVIELLQYIQTDEYANMIGEYIFLANHKEMWKDAPYAPSFNTVDAVVVQSGHILLIRRRAAPGIGLWALPGGYLNPDETQLEGMIRELKEETLIKVPEKVLRGSIVQHRTFDDPYRSPRGRIVTQAYHIQLNNVNNKLPTVKGSDDADKAKWVTLNEFIGMRDQIFEDHYHIVKSLLGI